MRIIVHPEDAAELVLAANLVRVLKIGAPVLIHARVTPMGTIDLTTTQLYSPVSVELVPPVAQDRPHAGPRDLIL